MVQVKRTECGKRCYHVKANQFARKAFSYLYMGLYMVRINAENKIKIERIGFC